MARKHPTRRTIAALILLAITAAICARLGVWQLDRAAQRDAITLAIQAGRDRPPLTLTPDTPGSELIDWRSAQATGTWLPGFTVLLNNRNLEGRPGYWVATPLQLQTPAGQAAAALLVLRGWVARVPGADSHPDIPPTPEGLQTPCGQIVSRVPRLFELWSPGSSEAGALPAPLPAASGLPPQVQNLDLQDYSRATGLKLLPVVLEQTCGDAGTGLARSWPQPSADADKNRGYAVQWFGFSAIALLAWLTIAWRWWSGRRRSPAA